MKKFIVSTIVLALLAAVGYGAYLYLLSPQTVMCTRLAQLCDIKEASAIQECESILETVAAKDKEAIREGASCVVNATTCGEGAGCVVGAGANIGLKELAPFLKAAPSLVNDFIEGVKRGSSGLFD